MLLHRWEHLAARLARDRHGAFSKLVRNISGGDRHRNRPCWREWVGWALFPPLLLGLPRSIGDHLACIGLLALTLLRFGVDAVCLYHANRRGLHRPGL